MNQRGFSQIEVLMAAIILSVIMVPVISGFFQAGQNFQYAYDYYRANLEAQHVLEQGQAFISRKKDLSEYQNRDDIFEVISSDSLSVSDFEYALALYKLSDGEVSERAHVFESRAGLWQGAAVRFSADNPAVFKNRPTAQEPIEGVSIVFDLPEEAFESYLALGSVYDKEGRLLKQMIKIMTTA